MPVPLTIVGGYLGAGKTTLINDLLAQAGQRIAVVVNDFGEVNIDAKLIRSADGDTIELVNGCICCSLSDGLGELLPRLARRDDLDAVVVEVSGVGEPGKLAGWMGYPGFSAGGVLVCADAGALGRLAGDRYVGDTVTAQLKVADLVLLTKGDAASPTQSAAAREVLEGANPGVPVLHTRRGPGRWEEIDVALAGALAPGRGFGGAGNNAANSEAPDSGLPSAENLHRSARLHSRAPIDRAGLVRALEAVASLLVRAKGIVRLGSAPDRATVLQFSSSGIELVPGGPWAFGDESELVLIAAGSDAEKDLARATAELARWFEPPVPTEPLGT
ncbi:CobW family GTP-binding protein [Paeniglutamicibacter sp. NPDC012692]|uniref:CobW family GTP-binding protein n=1 Tax=Paeniglutamicibacter sp. NPDC012692 TaxID=3364388 RepID=UPI003694A34A